MCVCVCVCVCKYMYDYVYYMYACMHVYCFISYYKNHTEFY